MKRNLILLFLFFSIGAVPSVAQNPGGVSSNLTFWIKANTTQPANITYNAGNFVSQWKSETGTFALNQANAGNQPLFKPVPYSGADFNFNPCIQFDSARRTTLFNPSTTPNMLGTNGTIFLVSNKNPAPSGRMSQCMLTYLSNTSYRFQMKPGFRIQNGVISTGYIFNLATLAGAVINYSDQAAMVFSTYNTGTNSRTRRNATDFGPPISAGLYFPAIQAGLALGSNSNNAEFNYMAAAEVIMYDRTLTIPEINRIESYLGIKYGVTFDEVPTSPTTNNYVSAGGTTIWDKTANGGYNNNIFGIGRDDLSGLLQKQSHSVNYRAPLILYNGNTAGAFPIMNDSNSTAFAADGSYLILGDNAGATTQDVCIHNGYITRIGRIWKAQKTGTVDTVTIAFNKDSLPACVSSVLISNDPLFPAGSTQIVPLSVSGNLKYAAVMLNNADYVSFGSDSIVLPVIDTVRTCSGNSITLYIPQAQSCVSYKWYDSPTAATPILAGDTLVPGAFSGDTTFYIEMEGPGGCVAADRATAVIFAQIVSSPESTVDTICPFNSTTLQVINPNASFTYNWYDDPSAGSLLVTGTSYTTPVISTASTYYLQVDSAGCSSVRVPVTVEIRPTPGIPTTNSPVSVCPNTTATLQVQNPVAGVTYTWHDAPTAGNLLVTGDTYTTNPMSVDTVFYVMGTNSYGCPDTRAAVSVIIYPEPGTPNIPSPVTICPSTATTLQVQNPVAGFTYTWYTAASGGTVLGTGETYATGNLSANAVYYVEATSPDGCKSAVRAVVNVNLFTPPAAPVITGDLNVCQYDVANLSISNPQAGLTYNWYLGSTGTTAVATGTTYTTDTITGATTITVTATDANGCEGVRGSATVQLWTQLPTPVVSVIDSTINSLTFSWNVIPGASGYEVSTDGITYGPPSSGSTGTTHTVTGLTPDQVVTLYVIALHPIACRNSLPGSATGKSLPEITDVYVPTAFTPNGDGLNDILSVLGNTIRSVHFTVYNRFGQLVFESHDQRKGWNGRFRNKLQPTGTYVYYVSAVMLDGSTRIKKGSVMLLR